MQKSRKKSSVKSHIPLLQIMFSIFLPVLYFCVFAIFSVFLLWEISDILRSRGTSTVTPGYPSPASVALSHLSVN